MRILVTDADNRAALAVTRSLGRAGHYVAVAHCRHPSLASSSRYCRQRVVVPDPLHDPAAFTDGISRAVTKYALDAVIPASDITTLTLAAAARDGRLNCQLCTPACDQVERASDKQKILELGQALRVPVPRTLVVEAPESPFVQPDFPFPVVVKPARSRVWHQGRWHFNSVTYAQSSARLQELLESFKAPQFPVLIQERIEGPGIGVFACYDHGRLVALFSHKRIREKPPSGGVSVLRESVPVDPAAGAHARALLEALHWHGVAMVEFKQDQRDGRLKLMEINGRLWGSLQLAVDAGIDFPDIMARLLAGERVEEITSYRTGVLTRWLWGDIDALLSLFLKSKQDLDLPPDHPGRWATLLRFLVPWQPGLHYEVLSISDPLPWLYETRHWFQRQ
jgi:predicted ATP-grasp superfamily ATP-dependent carboligase